MAHQLSITLTDHLQRFVSRQVETGRYATADEAVRDGLRLLEDRETQLDALRQALIAGERSGEAEYSLEGVIDALNRDAPHWCATSSLPRPLSRT